MSSFNNITIRARLFASLTVLTIVLIGIVAIAITYNQQLARMTEGLTGTSIPGLTYIIEADRDMQQALVAERSMFFAEPGSERLKSLQKDHVENVEQAITRANKYAAIAAHPEGKTLAANFVKAHEAWSKTTNTVEQLRETDASSAIELSYGESAKTFEAARDLLDQITEIEQEVSKQAALLAQDKAENSFSMVLTGGVIGIIICVLMAIIFPRMVVTPIDELTARLNDIAEGEGNLVARLTVDRGDEIGALALAFNRFIEKIHNLVKNVDNITTQLAGASTHLSEVANRTSEKTSQQRTETGMVATAVNEMSASIQEVARSAAQAAQAARDADQHSAKGEAAVEQTITRIDNLASAVEKVGQVIQRLDADTQNIGKVIDVIKGIAEQTNLLALNAAIEAARAGEQGRGFAVVADEVRTLASRTQDSTNEIMDMIQRLQSGASEAVSTMEKGQTATEETVAQATNTKQVLDAIQNAVSSISDMNAQIAAAAEEQSSVAEELNRNITVISDIGNENAKSSEETAIAGEELSSLAEQLQRQVGAFKI